MLNIILNKELLKTYNKSLYIKINNIEELPFVDDIPLISKRLVLLSLNDLRGANLVLLFDKLIEQNYLEIYEILSNKTFGLKGLKTILLLDRKRPSAKVGRASKIENLTYFQKKDIISWINKEISLEECVKKTKISQASLYVARKKYFSNYIAPTEKDTVLLRRCIKDYLMKRMSLEKVLRVNKINYSLFNTVKNELLKTTNIADLIPTEVESTHTIKDLIIINEKNIQKNISILNYDFEQLKYSIDVVKQVNLKTLVINEIRKNKEKYFSENSYLYLYNLKSNIQPDEILKSYIYERFSKFDDQENLEVLRNKNFISKVKDFIDDIDNKANFIRSIMGYCYYNNQDKKQLVLNKAVLEINNLFYKII